MPAEAEDAFEYIKPSQPVHDGVLGLQPEDLINTHIDAREDRNYVYSWFPPSPSASSDNFRYSFRMRFKTVNNLLCPKIMVEIGCETNFLYFNLTNPGCTGTIDAQFGEHFLDGKTTDLSPFGCKVEEWQQVGFVVKDKIATVYINQKPIFTRPYSESAGILTGLVFVSNGLLEVDDIDLTSLDGKVIYRDSF